MTGQAPWIVVIVMILAAALIGFVLGRANGSGAKQRLHELEEEVGRKDAEISSYKREVDAHFDRTASLFVSMAGSYKDLFEHLSSGYEKLSPGSSRDLFRERVATLLLDSPDEFVSRASEMDESQAGREDATPEAGSDAVADHAATSETAAYRSEGDAIGADEASAVQSAEEAGPVPPAQVAEAEEEELRAVDAAQRSADEDGGTPVAHGEPQAAEAMQAEKQEEAKASRV